MRIGRVDPPDGVEAVEEIGTIGAQALRRSDPVTSPLRSTCMGRRSGGEPA